EVMFNTFSGNVGNGINILNIYGLAQCVIQGNIFANHTTNGTYGIKTAAASSGTQAQNDRIRAFNIADNWFYGNTNNAQNLTVAGTLPTGLVTGDSAGV